MLNISHWDLAVDFTGLQAAALILGIDPRHSSFEAIHAEPVLERLRRGYSRALESHHAQVVGSGPLEENPSSPGILESQALRDEAENVSDIHTAHDFIDWLGTDGAAFENQRFSRDALTSWLKSVGVPSFYRFEAIVPTTQPSSVPEPSLSTRERNTLLKLLLGMAIQGYRYDPAASRSSVSKEIADDLAAVGLSMDEDTVRNWLKKAFEAVGSGSPTMPP